METLEVTPVNPPPNYINDTIRDEILVFSKDFKKSWIGLGRHLYAVWQDKLYRNWGFEKFEDYVEEEVGLKKAIAMKLLKSYLFIEQDEPQYFDPQFMESRTADKIPSYDEINFLRLAKSKKEVTKNDYAKLKHDVFEKGKLSGALQKDLTALMKERKQVDPDEERDQRNQAAIRKLVTSIQNFQKDMTALKLLPDEILEQAKTLMLRLEEQLD